MKFILVIFIIFAGSFSEADSFDLQRRDHQLHIAASAGLTFVTTQIVKAYKVPHGKSVLYGSLITLTYGLLKEILIDTEFSNGDMVANGIGTGVGAGLAYAIEF